MSHFKAAKKCGAVNTSCHVHATISRYATDRRTWHDHALRYLSNDLVLFATVAELVYAQDLGSCGVSPWEFESPRSHFTTLPDTAPVGQSDGRTEKGGRPVRR